MPYGNLSLKMREALKPIVTGRIVHDLGAGDCDHARTLLSCGALQVVAVEKEPIQQPRSKNIRVIHGYIADVPIPEDLDVVFLGWPVNHVIPGLLTWLEKARVVIYLGCNFDGSACGFPALFEHLGTRRLISYRQEPRNSLIVVEEVLPEPREKTPEEAAVFVAGIVVSRLNR